MSKKRIVLRLVEGLTKRCEGELSTPLDIMNVLGDVELLVLATGDGGSNARDAVMGGLHACRMALARMEPSSADAPVAVDANEDRDQEDS